MSKKKNLTTNSNSFIRTFLFYYNRNRIISSPSVAMHEVTVECNRCKNDIDIGYIREISIYKGRKDEIKRVCPLCLEYFKKKAKKNKIELVIHGSMKKNDENLIDADVIDVHELITENRNLYKVKSLLRARNLLSKTDVIIKYTVIDGKPIDVICPICKVKKQINVPETVINEAKQLTSISISKDIVCSHHFQAFVDKNFIVRGYQKVDYHIEEALKEFEDAIEQYGKSSRAAVSEQSH